MFIEKQKGMRQGKPHSNTLGCGANMHAGEGDEHTDSIPPSSEDQRTLEDRAASQNLTTEKSRGVCEMEVLLARITPIWLGIIFGSFMILSYTLSLSEFGWPEMDSC